MKILGVEFTERSILKSTENQHPPLCGFIYLYLFCLCCFSFFNCFSYSWRNTQYTLHYLLFLLRVWAVLSFRSDALFILFAERVNCIVLCCLFVCLCVCVIPFGEYPTILSCWNCFFSLTFSHFFVGIACPCVCLRASPRYSGNKKEPFHTLSTVGAKVLLCFIIGFSQLFALPFAASLLVFSAQIFVVGLVCLIESERISKPSIIRTKRNIY